MTGLKTARFLIAALLAAAPARAAFEQGDVGARARGMGAAFTAVADDSSAIYWNPAALAGLPSREAAFSQEDRFGLGLVNVTHLALAYPGVGPGGVGISWTRAAAGKKAQGFDYSEDVYAFAYGAKVGKSLSVGSALNFHHLDAASDASGITLNLSARLPLWKERVGLGALWRNVLQTTLRYDTGAKDEFPRQVKVGAFLAPAKSFRLSYDMDNIAADGDARSHAGAEWRGKTFALRAGLSQKEAADFEWCQTAGASVNFKSLALDYAFEQHFDLGGTHVFSVRLTF